MGFLSNALFVIAVLPMGVVAIDMFIIVMNAATGQDEETKPRQSGRGLLRTKRGLWWLGLVCASGLVVGSSVVDRLYRPLWCRFRNRLRSRTRRGVYTGAGRRLVAVVGGCCYRHNFLYIVS